MYVTVADRLVGNSLSLEVGVETWYWRSILLPVRGPPKYERFNAPRSMRRLHQATDLAEVVLFR